MYSESKFSNWASYDPQRSEVNALVNARPAATYRLVDDQAIKLFVLPLHDEFIRPFGSDDVIMMLDQLPRDMLEGISEIVLFGGTKRQARFAWNENWRYGCYGYGSIYLFAYPKRRMICPSPRLHAPAALHAYERAGVKITHESGKWVYRFNEDSIRRFYLWDVLVHEIGHHVDRFHHDRSTKRSERFADWYARTYGFEAEQSDVERKRGNGKGDITDIGGK